MLKLLSRSVLLATALVACSDPASPEPDPPANVTGVYELKTIAGADLPAPYLPVTSSYLASRVSHVITLLEDGTGTSVAVTQEGVSGDTYEENSTFSWTLNGATLSITFDCPELGSCIAGPHLVGTVTETSLTVTESPIMRVPMVFELQPDQM